LAKNKRVNIKAILADPDLRRKLMVSTIQATQAREGIETTPEQAERAYYVVTEGEKAAFFDVERYKPAKKQSDRRNNMFVQAIRNDAEKVRFDVARRDFLSIEGSPLSYRRIALVSHIFREHPASDPTWGFARQGKATGDDPKWVRQYWEVVQNTGWVSFAKGGEFCRFYSDIDLVIDWRPENRDALKASGNALPSLEHYFKPGLTWSYRSQRGFSPRILPGTGIHGHVGHSFFPLNESDQFFLLGIFSSHIFLFMLGFFSTFGKYEVGMIKKVPIPKPSANKRESIENRAKLIFDAKSAWDNGNEISTHFDKTWILRESIIESGMCIPERLDKLLELESAEDLRIQKLYAELNDDAYHLYGIPDKKRAEIEEIMGTQPPELIWPQMEGKSAEQKRMEHVWRLLSYIVKRVVDEDEDGIVPFMAVSGETALIDRVHKELALLFLGRDINQVEIEIVNELKNRVKGYKSVESIRQWLEEVYFEYHASLYKNRPIIWHIASRQNKGEAAFGALVHYHKFDANRLAKLRGSYLRDAIDLMRREAAMAAKENREADRIDWQARLEETQELDRLLEAVQEGRREGKEGGDKDFRILTPWKSPKERPKGWDPDINDGVKVNIEPLQKAGVLRIAKVV